MVSSEVTVRLGVEAGVYWIEGYRRDSERNEWHKVYGYLLSKPL